MTLAMDGTALAQFMEREFPQLAADFVIERLAEQGLLLRLRVEDRHLRPGGTVSGPSMFALADCAFYLTILARVGPEALAVTTSCAIDFLRRPEAGRDLLCETRLLKLGRALVVGDALIFSEGDEAAPVARASLTYSRPPRREAAAG
ncbi:PaaI family thioesterase [Tropicimonas sp. IMCC34043]|uniref:PaaI family thioesterase n=1 Tax=Tropicimonas sp. IMCC34043 TaxID=2248760 RepID=UPI000E26CE1E|nr:PaaI family thioesterase [Tropicimonas sp. IMCC34043]